MSEKPYEVIGPGGSSVKGSLSYKDACELADILQDETRDEYHVVEQPVCENVKEVIREYVDNQRSFPSAFEHQEAGNHYASLGIQPNEYILKNNLGWNAGNIVKYVSRAERKGLAVDYKKIIHYAAMELEGKYGIRSRIEYSE